MDYSTETEKQNPTIESLSKKGKRTWIYITIAVLIALGIIFFYAAAAPADFPSAENTITITPGESLKSLGTELSEKHYIRSRFIFATVVSLLGDEHRLSPGDYYLPHPVNVFALAEQIGSGNHNLNPIKITIPEGDTVAEIGLILKDKLPALPIDNFLKEAKPDEGYLFPETYFVYPKVSPNELIDQMKIMFGQKTNPLFSAANVTGQNKTDAVILASLIEREAHGDDDRATIAGILIKRLSLGMPLQVDATVAYANNKEENDLTKADFSIDSPYNTYKYKGLPPGPIANPGLLALTAALNPAPTSYLYYLHDKHGTIHYAKTYAEHLANIKKYL